MGEKCSSIIINSTLRMDSMPRKPIVWYINHPSKSNIMEVSEKRGNTPLPSPDPQFDFGNGFNALKNPQFDISTIFLSLILWKIVQIHDLTISLNLEHTQKNIMQLIFKFPISSDCMQKNTSIDTQVHTNKSSFKPRIHTKKNIMQLIFKHSINVNCMQKKTSTDIQLHLTGSFCGKIKI